MSIVAPKRPLRVQLRHVQVLHKVVTCSTNHTRQAGKTESSVLPARSSFVPGPPRRWSSTTRRSGAERVALAQSSFVIAKQEVRVALHDANCGNHGEKGPQNNQHGKGAASFAHDETGGTHETNVNGTQEAQTDPPARPWHDARSHETTNH